MKKERKEKLEERKTGFLGSFHVVFDDFTNNLAFGITQHHGIFIAQATAHVPAESQCFVSDGFCLGI